ANYLAPLITVPYLARVLGRENFGIVGFVQALILYLVALSDYGFRFSATRKISILRDDKAQRDTVFSSVLLIKFAIVVLELLVLVALIAFEPKFRAEKMMYIFAFGTLVGNIFLLDWFFQGVERMKYITVLNLIGRTITVVAIFTFVRTPSHYVYVPLFYSLGAIFVGVASMWTVRRHFNVRLSLPAWNAVREELRDGWHVFLTVATANIYTSGVPLLLGFFASYTAVSYYVAAEKIVQAGTAMLEPFSRAIFPHIGLLSTKSKDAALALLRKIVRVIGPLTLLISVAVALAAPWIISIMGKQYDQSIPVMRILAFLFFAKGLGHIFLLQTMLNFKHDQAVFRIVLASAVLCVISAFIFIPLWSYLGAAIAGLVPEMAMLLFSGVYVQKRYGLIDWRSVLPAIRSKHA
ncbi:MAG TPA: flippase, partial [Thermoguttaceae bacterium]|nr:flippase [Thermoguttaceae bacterium]